MHYLPIDSRKVILPSHAFLELKHVSCRMREWNIICIQDFRILLLCFILIDLQTLTSDATGSLFQRVPRFMNDVNECANRHYVKKLCMVHCWNVTLTYQSSL